jgi:MFS family permease
MAGRGWRRPLDTPGAAGYPSPPLAASRHPTSSAMASAATGSDDGPAEPSSAFRYPRYVLFWLSRLCVTFAVQIIAVAVGWQVYDLTRDPFDLGLIGLVQFLPSAVLVLFTGSAADRFSRRLIMMICLAVEAAGALVLLVLALKDPSEVWPIYVVLVAIGCARAFYAPASQAAIPSLVPEKALAHAITWMVSAWQLATIVGPVAGGLLYGLSAETAYGVAFALLIASAGLVSAVSLPRPAIAAAGETAWAALSGGFRYLKREPIVLGAISLDLFAVLLGGATALLPAVARDVLEVDSAGLGLLRAAPGAGALVVAGLLSVRPIGDRAGLVMFASVALFGAATVVFGLSTVTWLSILSLAVMGGADMVSVTIRETLLQLWTPDALRGRVNAVNMVFVGASNELGEFRAGMAGALVGVMPAIVAGGVGTIAVAAIWMGLFPALRNARRLDRAEATAVVA